mmetsp:Transcript_39867/g.106441  ORF Transcript_39867/g.106441 Transcript_39867/m.106441 type:complete len:994 (-) Transcript_39867:405-3386(-)
MYNVVLRQFPEDEYERLVKQAQEENPFSTTIFVLVSAVRKIARVMKLPPGLKLYRGLGGAVKFPKSFYKADQHGCRGFTEWGFMSTTANIQVALQYSGVKDRSSLPCVLVTRVGAVDRGACIMEYSQYPNEEEYLWVPGSFIEQENGGDPWVQVTKDGIVEMVPVKVSANLKGNTTDELEQLKKKMHLTAFKYRIGEVKATLEARVKSGSHEDGTKVVTKRYEADTKAVNANIRPKDFVDKIVKQCWEIYSRHNKINHKYFLDDSVFRQLVFEMVEVKAMAMSKFDEWLENITGSSLVFRLNAELRTARRRYIAFKNRYLTKESPRDKFLEVCQLRGLVTKSLDEQNELVESRLVAAAADGKSPADLELLLLAGAKVDWKRPDGVTALILAAQFGYSDNVVKLIQYKATVDMGAKNEATAVYMAAQSGFETSIETLAKLKADLDKPDVLGLTPLHQAAMNSNVECIKMLLKHQANPSVVSRDGKTPLETAVDAECQNILAPCTSSEPESFTRVDSKILDIKGKALIITSGDISDVDGFMALAAYAQTGEDVVFVMNYPAYLGVDVDDPDFPHANPGQGYRYTVEQVFRTVNGSDADKQAYKQFMERYDEQCGPKERMKQAMTDLAFAMVRGVWQESAKDSTARCFFCVGGVNTINPFASAIVKNEVLVYARVVASSTLRLASTDEGMVYSVTNGSTLQELVQGSMIGQELRLSDYRGIFMDFNGSMAFLGPNSWWVKNLEEAGSAGKILGFFMMGGVHAHVKPQTLPAMPNVLNRFSSATMNQLYHPENTGRVLDWLAQHVNVPIFCVSNNVVHDLSKLEGSQPSNSSLGSVQTFMESNGLTGPFLRELAVAYYTSGYKPPRKAFDFYCATALVKFKSKYDELANKGSAEIPTLHSKQRKFFYSNTHGLSLLSDEGTWESAVEVYMKQINTTPKVDDSEKDKKSKELFEIEKLQMGRFLLLPYVLVQDLSFSLDHDLKLDVEAVERSAEGRPC